MTDDNIIQDFLNFLNKSCTAFHAVDTAKEMLLQAGFIHLNESETWTLSLGKSYFFIRSGTTIMSFTIGGKYVPGNGFTVIGAHTDSPCLKLKPNPCSKKLDALVLNTQPYGGGLWHTWFDRDLGLAGRVIVNSTANTLQSRLVNIDTPIARIPNLAIHLTSGSERDHFAPNLQEHAKAIITMNSNLIATKADSKAEEKVDHTAPNKKKVSNQRFHPFLLQLIKEKLSLSSVDEIVDMELQLQTFNRRL